MAFVMETKPLLTIELPLPPQELRPNWRGHWAAKARKTKEYRSRAKWAAIRELGELGDPGDLVNHLPVDQASVRITMLNKTARKMDQDNLIASCKAAMDGLTDAGVWSDDRDVTILSPIRAKDKDNPRLILEIWSKADG